MNRKDWKNAVENIIPQLCITSGLQHTWKKNALVVSDRKLSAELVAGGIFFTGSERKDTSKLIHQLNSPKGPILGKPCQLTDAKAYHQGVSNRLAITATLPTDAIRLGSVINEVSRVIGIIDKLGPAPWPAPAKKCRPPKASWTEKCELAVVIAESLVKAGYVGWVTPQMSQRVFGIADHAPIIGISNDLQLQRKINPNAKFWNEHIVPCKVITEILLTNNFLKFGSVKQRAEKLQTMLNIYQISNSEQQRLDKVFRLKECMPSSWDWINDSPMDRLSAAGIS